MEQNTSTHSHGLNGIYWDGESALLMAWEPGELPVELASEDQKLADAEYRRKRAERPVQTYRGPTFTAEDIDRKCSEMEYMNRWYR